MKLERIAERSFCEVDSDRFASPDFELRVVGDCVELLLFTNVRRNQSGRCIGLNAWL